MNKGRTPIVMVTAPGRPTRRVRMGLCVAMFVAALGAVVTMGFSIGWVMTGAPTLSAPEASR